MEGRGALEKEKRAMMLGSSERREKGRRSRELWQTYKVARLWSGEFRTGEKIQGREKHFISLNEVVLHISLALSKVSLPS